MTDPLIDDVKALLDKEKGDERILKQISRACENNEVISNYERNYVRKLAEKYLGRAPQIEENLNTEKIPIISDVVISKTPSQQKIETSTYPQTMKLKSKNTKMFLGIGGAIFAIIIIIGASVSGLSFIKSDDTETPIDSSTLSIQTDLPTYQKGDIISISGTSNTIEKINLSIENRDGQLVWSEQVSVKNNGRFSTLTIAGGPGWDKSGTFTIKVENTLETASKTFSFNE